MMHQNQNFIFNTTLLSKVLKDSFNPDGFCKQLDDHHVLVVFPKNKQSQLACVYDTRQTVGAGGFSKVYGFTSIFNIQYDTHQNKKYTILEDHNAPSVLKVMMISQENLQDSRESRSEYQITHAALSDDSRNHEYFGYLHKKINQEDRVFILMPNYGMEFQKFFKLHHKSLSLDEKKAIALAFIQQVENLHQKNIAHLDIKLDNFIYKKEPNGSIKCTLIDYGLSKYNIKQSFDQNEPMGGTIGYLSLAPYLLMQSDEQYIKENCLQYATLEKSDQFALAMVLVQLFNITMRDEHNNVKNIQDYFTECDSKPQASQGTKKRAETILSNTKVLKRTLEKHRKNFMNSAKITDAITYHILLIIIEHFNLEGLSSSQKLEQDCLSSEVLWNTLKNILLSQTDQEIRNIHYLQYESDAHMSRLSRSNSVDSSYENNPCSSRRYIEDRLLEKTTRCMKTPLDLEASSSNCSVRSSDIDIEDSIENSILAKTVPCIKKPLDKKGPFSNCMSFFKNPPSEANKNLLPAIKNAKQKITPKDAVFLAGLAYLLKGQRPSFFNQSNTAQPSDNPGLCSKNEQFRFSPAN